MVSYIAHVLSKLEPEHVHNIALVFVSVASLITAFSSIFVDFKQPHDTPTEIDDYTDD